MPTATQKRRLIEGIAYIESHRDLWDQSMWHSVDKQLERNTCGTVGCLAGHLALTLNPSRPVVKFDKKLFEKPASERTPEERRLIDNVYYFSDFVRATSDDPEEIVRKRRVGRETIPTVHVRHRAARLIGMSLIDAQGDYGLFAGRNGLSDIYRLGANHVGVSTGELRRMVKAVISERGWDKAAAKRAAKRTSA